MSRDYCNSKSTMNNITGQGTLITPNNAYDVVEETIFKIFAYTLMSIALFYKSILTFFNACI